MELTEEQEKSLERGNANHTFEVSIVLGNLQEHQLEALELLVGKLELNGVKCHAFDIHND